METRETTLDSDRRAPPPLGSALKPAKGRRRARLGRANPSRAEPAPPLQDTQRRKFRRTRDFVAAALGRFGLSWDYTRRTYREGKHIKAYWRGFRACPTRKPWPTILAELLRVAWKWKILPFNYFRNALYDRATPYNDDYLSFMPEPVLFTRYMPILSPAQYRMTVHNKFIFGRLLRGCGFRTPEPVVWCYDSVLYDGQGAVADDSALARSLRNHAGRDLVMKSQNGGRGDDVSIVTVASKNKGCRLLDQGGEVLSHARLRGAARKLDDWQIEAKVEQHPEIAAIYPHSVNTLRIVTLALPDGEVRILAALMRMGRNGSVIDNASAGGIHAHIDVASGRLIGPAYCKTDNATFAAHPNTGHVIGATELPHWPAALDTARRAAATFMHTHTTAWDIAIDPDGPVIIEGNPTWNPGTMERGSFPKGDLIIEAAEAWRAQRA